MISQLGLPVILPNTTSLSLTTEVWREERGRSHPSEEMRYANYPGTTDCELHQPHTPMVFFLPFRSTNYLRRQNKWSEKVTGWTE